MMEGSLSRGVIRLSGNGGDGGLVDGTIDGLPPGVHKLNIHVAGDISQVYFSFLLLLLNLSCTYNVNNK